MTEYNARFRFGLVSVLHVCNFWLKNPEIEFEARLQLIYSVGVK